MNLPAVSKSPVAGFAFVPHSDESHSLGFEPVDESKDKVEYQFNGPYQNRPATQPADVRYVFDGYISATRLKLGTSVDEGEVKTEEFK